MLKKLYVLGLVLASVPAFLFLSLLFDGDNISSGVFVAEIISIVFIVKASVRLLINGTKKPAI